MSGNNVEAEMITICTRNDVSFAECDPSKKLISTESDAVDLIGLCGYYETNNVMIYAENVDDSFFELKSKLAGAVLQKCMNYHMRVAMILPQDFAQNKRFSEMTLESNKGSHFRVFQNRNNAEEWLLHG